jgi:predicted TIM-barrel fold metal-dependent hydrolase
MIIDAHAHACGTYYRPENILRSLDQNGVDKVLLCPGLIDDEKNHRLPNLAAIFRKRDLMPAVNVLIRRLSGAVPAATLAQRNEYVHTLAGQNPQRILQCYWTDPAAPDALETLKRHHRAWSFKALKAHQGPSRFSASSETMDAIARFAGEEKLPFLIHLYGRQDVRDFIHLVRHNRNTVFIVAHLIGLELLLKAEPGILRNVYWEISPPALISDKRVLKAINHFGAQRVVLGSDTPYGLRNLEKNLHRLERMSLSAIERNLVLGDNMRSLLGL